MDKWLTLQEAETKLQGFTRFDVFYAAIDNRINMYWCPGNIEGIDIVKVESIKTTDIDGLECERWRRVKGCSVIEHEFGPFLIDALIDDRWPMILSAIKDGEPVNNVIWLHDDPIRFKDLQGDIYSVYFDNPHDYVLPRPNELRVSSSELRDIKKILKAIRDGSTTVGKITYIRQKFIKEYLDKNNMWHRVNEIQQKRGKSTFKAELWKNEDFRGKKDKNGKFIFANLDGSEPEKQNFYDAIKEVINNTIKVRGKSKTLTTKPLT